MTPMGTFSFVTLNLRSARGDLENCWVCSVTGSHYARIGFLGPLQVLHGQKRQFLANFLKLLNWQFTVPQVEGMLENQKVAVNQ